MKRELSVEKDFNLNEDRPLAGEVRKYPLGEAIFFSPKPVPSANVIPGGLGESNKILEINDVYMDIGQSSNGKALQVQLVMSCIVFMAIVFFSVFIVLAVSDKYMYDSFFHALWSSLKEEGGIAFSPILFLLCIGWYVIISSSLKKSRQRPIRFNRQRREICYFESDSKVPTIVPWEETVSWVSIYRGYTGSAIVSNVTFGLAFPDATKKNYWLFKRPVGIMEEGQRSWEIIRCYMEEDSGVWAKKSGNENRKTFDSRRNELKSIFKSSSKPLFAWSMSDPSASYFNMFMYYVVNILCLWKLPYMVSEWDSKISMAKFPKEIDEWSTSLPKELWSEPSEELRKQKLAVEKHYAAGGNLSTFNKRGA